MICGTIRQVIKQGDFGWFFFVDEKGGFHYQSKGILWDNQGTRPECVSYLSWIWVYWKIGLIAAIPHINRNLNREHGH